MSNIIYGLDFGTTNSTLMAYNNGAVTPVKLDPDGNTVMRTLLFFPDESFEYYIGRNAIDHYLASGMKGRLIQSIKSVLPDDLFEGTEINKEWYELEDLIAFFFRELKSVADRSVNQDVKQVVVGRPARFSDDDKLDALAQQRLQSAATKAGFTDVHFQLEPIAAALLYEQQLTEPELVLVVDLGGGTADFTVMKLAPDKKTNPDRTDDILYTDGVRIGGDLFNSTIMWHKLTKYFGRNLKWKGSDKWLDMPARFIRTICEWRKIPYLKSMDERKFVEKLQYISDDPEAVVRLAALIDENLGFSLFESIEVAKCGLSERDVEQIVFRQSVIDISEQIGRLEFEVMIEGEVEALKTMIKKVMHKSGVATKDIQSVFMTGGTSYVPVIRKAVAKMFGVKKIKSADAFTSVANGLALSARLF